ncbi:Six-hairpin glycosidase [Macroventuria anomochaeta]|uniref:Six-hairpin glycosidase n=1 Tax=Macroventuria anomochaeta TaxID=301207 RepID=A0ACB6S1A4_9PLEO|nr:Six-hairpin glycosidase [Macroventuria anomochaeta]KAF2627941.1 Six-hairpin glycosidase [Macroventuria anomochaeta]
MSQPAISEPVSTSLIDKVLSQAQATASHSWEFGVVFEALLEYHNPSLTVFHTPVSQHKKHLSDSNGDVKVLKYIKPFIRTDSTTLCKGNGSSADPASLGIPALFLSLSDPNSTYLPAAQRQINHLLTSVPRLPNGAISHREAIASAWADFIYMVPPFLAYYGMYTDDEGMVREAVRQCRLYHKMLRTEKGLWKHIVNVGDSAPGEREEDDKGLWNTSNGWAAAGMARVLATVRGSRFVGQMHEEQSFLVKLVEDIICGAMDHDTDNSGLLRNYVDDETWWGEVAGTALLTATVFRMAVLEPGIFGTKYTNWALLRMDTVGRCIDVETGIAAPVVNPLRESQRTPLSGSNPEGQAFVVLMYAAWRDWKARTAVI